MRGSRRFVISVLLVAAVAGGLLAATFALRLRPRLGLDLQGGLSVTLTAPPGTRADVLEKTVEVLRNRVDRAGVAEPEISTEGSSNVLIQIPRADDPKRLLDLIGKTAQLQFRQVKAVTAETDPNYATETVSGDDAAEREVVLPGKEGTKYRLEPAVLTGEAVKDADAVIRQDTGAWEVQLRFDREGSRKWEEFTGRLACVPAGTPTRQVAIALDARVESAPQVGEEVECNKGITGGTTIITGDFDEREAKDLALVLKTGALPVELEQSQVVTVSPTLGRESLNAGLIAGALGLALVMVYVLLYYRALGLQTWVGLLVFGSIIYGLVVLLGEGIGWSLTLAGIAGLIVSVGIATDSYIVFFERVKEEVHEGKTLRSSVGRGFTHAWRTLRTANFVTILAAITLYFLAVGPVRGFALALGVATTLDLGVTYGLTWPLASLLARNRFFSEAPFIGMRRALEGGRQSLMRKIYRSEFNIDFIGRRRMWALLSGALVAVSIAALVPGVRGLRFGIDFRGGTIFRSPVETSTTVPEISSAVAAAGTREAVVQILEDRRSGKKQVQVQTEAIKDLGERDKVIAAVAAAAGVPESEVDIEAVGEKWGRQITTKSLRGLAIFLVLVILYMSWRLEPKMSVSGIVALLHDLVITAGVYALVGFEATPATVIATLTILGYSLYDTVVVFDKIRENSDLPSNAKRPFAQIANESMNQVLMRSINTSLTTLIPVGSLLFVGSALLGADSLRDLALALFVGIAVGTYSSVFVASPLLSVWKEREPRYRAVRTRVLRAQPAALGPERPDDLEVEEAPEAEPLAGGVAAAPERPTRVQQRRRPRSKRRKGRR